MALHAIEPDRRTLHGHFSRDLPAVLTIDPGDTVRFRTLDGGWGLERPRGASEPRRRLEPRDARLDAGHALSGPVAIRGAEPGMTLEVRIDAIVPGAYGWTRSGGWPSPLNSRLGFVGGEEHLLIWDLDVAAGRARDQHGRSVALRPFMGVIGMPPPQPGIHSTIPPRETGGNIDCKELVAGSRLYLPVAVPGALVSVGDGHGAQGDGEVSGLAIECPMDRVDLTFHLREDIPIKAPLAETAAGTITFGFHATLDEAMALALEGMLDVLCARHSVDRREALALASVVVDLHVTQAVNGCSGVHAILPPGAIR